MLDRSRYARGIALAAVAALGIGGLAACEPLTGLNSVAVTTTTDGWDAQPGDGVCEMTVDAGDCSLRAAVDEANADDEIIYVTVPAGIYELDGGGVDDANITGDLDVDPASGQLTFLAPRGTVVDANGSDAGFDARSGLVFLNGISVTGASGPGHVAQAGSDLWVFGGSPHGNAGPGIQYEAGSRGQVRNTTLSGNSRGIVNRGTVTVALSTITANGGAGLTGEGTTTVTGSIVANQTSGGDCGFPVVSAGWNAFGQAGCGIGADDSLSPALVLTPELVDGVPGFVPGDWSPDVRDAIPNGAGPCHPGLGSVDQHAVARPVGAACDKGALETEPPSNRFVVDSAVDAPDADTADGTCDDGTGACTLRAAVAEANEVAGTDPGVITIAPGVDPVLAPGTGPSSIHEALVIDRSVTIDGDGATIEMNDREEVFVVEQGDATFRDLTLTGSDSTGGFVHSGASPSSRSLTLDHVTTAANTFNGIEFHGDAATIVDSTIRDTGRVALRLAVDDLLIERSTFELNKDSMFASAERAVVRDSIFRGGQFLLVLTVTESALIEGTTVTEGDGAIVDGPDVVIRNSTISGNYASGLTVRDGAVVRVESSTIVDNFWFGILAGADSEVTVGASVIAQYEHACERVTPGAPTAQFLSAGSNLVSDASCGFAAPGDAVVVDPLLGPVADNGGPTPTNLPEAGSPVIDAVPAGTVGLCDGTIVTDQRGVVRPQGPACDIGAVEVDRPLVVDSAADGSDTDPGDGACDDGTGACTLRAAVQEANTESGGVVETITVAPGIDPVLTIAEPLAIAGGLVIDGGGATITASIPSNVFEVQHLDTTFRDLTITGTNSGAGIVSAGTDAGRSVILDHVAITFAVSSPSNAGVVLAGAALTIADSQIIASGGRALDASVVDLVIERSSVQGKDAVVVENEVTERVVLRDSTVRGGDLDLYLIDIGESVLIERSTVTNSFYGSSVSAPEVTVRASTFAGSSGGPGFSGSTSLEITASTFATVGSYAGVSLSGGTVTVRGTVVSGSYTTTACWISPTTTVVSGGYNSSSDTSCGFTGTGDVQGVVSNFGPLASNGGPTQTRLPVAGSPLIGAIPAGTPGLCDGTPATVDQRGVARPQGAACDVGAVEQ